MEFELVLIIKDKDEDKDMLQIEKVISNNFVDLLTQFIPVVAIIQKRLNTSSDKFKTDLY